MVELSEGGHRAGGTPSLRGQDTPRAAMPHNSVEDMANISRVSSSEDRAGVTASSNEDSHRTVVPANSREDGHRTVVPANSSEDGHRTVVPANSSDAGHRTVVPANSSDDGHRTVVPANSSDDGHRTVVLANSSEDAHRTVVSANSNEDSHRTNGQANSSEYGHRTVGPAHSREDGHRTVVPANSSEDGHRTVGPANSREDGHRSAVLAHSQEDGHRTAMPTHSREDGHVTAVPAQSSGVLSEDLWSRLVDPAHLESARNVVFTNSKSLRDVGLNASALYSFYSLMNHSCVSNTSLCINKDLRWIIDFNKSLLLFCCIFFYLPFFQIAGLCEQRHQRGRGDQYTLWRSQHWPASQVSPGHRRQASQPHT